MKLYDYLFVFSLFVLSIAINLFVTKEFLTSEIKVVDVKKLMDEKEIVKKIYSGEISPQEAVEMQMEKAEKIRQILQNEKGLVLIKQCVLGGQYEDITELVAKKLR